MNVEAPVPVDLSAFITLDEITHEITRNDRPTGWFWRLADTGHPAVVAFRNEQDRKALRKQAALEEKRMNGRKVKIDEEDPIQNRRDLVAMVAARVVGFNDAALPKITDLPNPVRYSPEMALRVLEHPKLDWVFLSIVNRLNDDQAFMPTEASN